MDLYTFVFGVVSVVIAGLVAMKPTRTVATVSGKGHRLEQGRTRQSSAVQTFR